MNKCIIRKLLLLVIMVTTGMLFAKELKYAPGGMIVKFSSEVNSKIIFNTIEGKEAVITNIASIDSISKVYKLKYAKKMHKELCRPKEDKFYGRDRKYVLQYDYHIDAEKVAEELKRLPQIEEAYPNYIHKIYWEPNDSKLHAKS